MLSDVMSTYGERLGQSRHSYPLNLRPRPSDTNGLIDLPLRLRPWA